MEEKKAVPRECVNSTQHSIYTRRCFVTGELCSKQTNVHKEREALHKKNEINAFVIMNFSEMSDIVYKWKLSSFIESLKQYLYLDTDGHTDGQQIACVSEAGKMPTIPPKKKWTPVEKINVIRADSNTASNYIVCSRICQQIQIADLIIVDVSVENTNVFYEFGLAAAYGKLILPICYSESFYEMKIPEKAADLLEKMRQRYANETNEVEKQKLKEEIEQLRTRIEHHIDCYPWRRKLFENYSIRYRNSNSHVHYGLFRDVIQDIYDFSDKQYRRFPYDTVIHDANKPLISIKDDYDNDDYKKVGFLIYDRLRSSYHTKRDDQHFNDPKQEYEKYEHTWDGDYSENQKQLAIPPCRDPHNTLVVYTMDGILNEKQAGLCIINFYNNMTYQIHSEHCFCGDRVAILSQSNVILDDPKDTKVDKKLLYGVGDIIRIGMNQATYVAHQQRIKPDDYLLDDRKPSEDTSEKSDCSEDTIRFVKEHIRNRCIPLLPDNPIYVKQYTEGIQQKLFDLDKLNHCNKYFDHTNFFTMFHMMLYTLVYANEVVVDISGNSLQALFWLGVAHGLDVPAITVRHTPTADEITRMDNPVLKKDRRIFDVAGLWTATLNSDDVDSFYDQLSLTQTGIEQHNRMTLPDIDTHRDDFSNLFYETWRHDRSIQKKAFEHFIIQKQKEESRKLESFYRNSFWRRLLRSNELDLYITDYDKKEKNDTQPLIMNSTWDVRATAELNKYLSKRTVIGRYTLKEFQPEDTGNTEANKKTEMKKLNNFISIGGVSSPLPTADRPTGKSLTQHIQEMSGCQNQIRNVYLHSLDNTNIHIRGFRTYDNNNGFFTQFPTAMCMLQNCTACCPQTKQNADHDSHLHEDTANRLHTFSKEVITGCELRKENKFHQQLAQMVLWRDIEDTDRSNIKFRVSLVGVSGPSTLALTSLLVDDQQKELLFKNREHNSDKTDFSWCKTPLKDLQHRIRSDILDEYDRRLKAIMGISDSTPTDTELFKQYEQLSYTTKLYLSTTLYQYFFPFLSLSDEKRIMNSMHTFLTAMSSAEGYPFQAFKDQVNLITKVEGALRETIEALRGVDILYTVTVHSKNGKADNRWPVAIRHLDNDHRKESVVCLFTSNTSSSESKSS